MIRRNPLTGRQLGRVLDLLGMGSERPVVTAVEPLGGEWAPVSRLRFDEDVVVEGRPVGRSLVVKTRRADDGGGRAWIGGHHLENEVSALELLSGTGLAPELVSVDLEAGVVVMNDLAPAPTVDELIRADDREPARDALLALARAMGRVHTFTAHSSPSLHDPRVLFGHWPGVDRWADVERAARALGFPDAAAARDDVAEVAAELSEPGPLLALTHTDMGPLNTLLTTPDRASFVDWEGSGFRHLSWDVSWLHYPFPNCSDRWSVLPPDVVRAVDEAYRAEVTRAIPGLQDDDAYRSMVACGCAASLAVRVHRLPLLAEEGQSIYDSWRRRTQLAHQIRVFQSVAADAGRFEALATWFAELEGAMQARWSDVWRPDAPLYSAFERPGGQK